MADVGEMDVVVGVAGAEVPEGVTDSQVVPTRTSSTSINGVLVALP